MNRMRCAVLSCLCALFLCCSVMPALALTDERYQELAAACPAFVEAEKKLAISWKALKAVAGKDFNRFLADQRQWIAETRDREAGGLAALGKNAPDKVKDEQGQPEEARCYALATTERAGKIAMLTRQVSGKEALTLTGRVRVRDNVYVFFPYPFATPFILCATTETGKMKPEALTALESHTAPESDAVRLTGFFDVPGRYVPDERLRIEKQPEGMSWREQDQWLD